MHAQQQQVRKIPILLKRLRTNIQGKNMQREKSKKKQQQKIQKALHMWGLATLAQQRQVRWIPLISARLREKLQGKDLQGQNIQGKEIFKGKI